MLVDCRALCNSVLMSESVLSDNVSADSNVVLHLCWDNSNLNEEMPRGSGKTLAAHLIAIQDTSAGVLRVESPG